MIFLSRNELVGYWNGARLDNLHDLASPCSINSNTNKIQPSMGKNILWVKTSLQSTLTAVDWVSGFPWTCVVKVETLFRPLLARYNLHCHLINRLLVPDHSMDVIQLGLWIHLLLRNLKRIHNNIASQWTGCAAQQQITYFAIKRSQVFFKYNSFSLLYFLKWKVHKTINQSCTAHTYTNDYKSE